MFTGIKYVRKEFFASKKEKFISEQKKLDFPKYFFSFTQWNAYFFHRIKL